MLSTAELIEKLRDAVSGSTSLSAWCVSKYGKVPTVFVGIDIENPPAEADYPVVVIEGITEVNGNAQNTLSWVADIGVGVYDETITSAAVTIPGETPEDDPVTIATTKTYSGVLDVETFREKVQALLKAERFAKLTFDSKAETINAYPEFISTINVTIEQIQTRRR